MPIELKDMDKISSRHIKVLQEHGVNSVEALAMQSRLGLEDMKGIGEKTAQKLIWEARDTLGWSEFNKASDTEEKAEYIHTGSKELDRILGGGLQTGRLTEVYGPFKSGKTNFAHTVAVTVLLPKENGGMNGNVAYIDTENTFSRSKIGRIAKRFGMTPKEALSRIFEARIYSSDHQLQMIQKAESLCKNQNVKLIVLDSLMALLRAEYVGIGMLARRQGVLNNMIHGLSRIAETYNCAVVLTNQVATQMKGMFSANDAIGGNIVAHGCHFRVMFKTKGFSANSSLQRRGIIVDAPDLPPEECEFFITSAGVADEETIEIPDDPSEVTLEKIDAEGGGNGANLDLKKVKGLGEATSDKLGKLGIKSIKDLLVADPSDIAKEISGYSKDQIVKLQSNARRLVS